MIWSLYWKVICRYVLCSLYVVKELLLLFNLNCLLILKLKRLGYAIALWKKLLNMSKMNHFNKTSLFSLTYISKSSFLSIELQSDKEIGKFNFQTRIEEERKKNEKKMTIIIVSKEDPAVCAKILLQEDNNKRFAYICNNFLIKISAFWRKKMDWD